MNISRLGATVAVALGCTTLPARGQAPPSSSHATPVPVAGAVRLDGSIAIDGRLADAAWQQATPATEFRQSQPEEGAPASSPMEVRVLYDDHALYIGARMHQPGGVVAPLARRDQLLDASGDNGSFNSLTTDKLIVRLDPYHNHLDDAWFEINPAGARGDQFNGDPSWDPIWDGAAHVDSLGWSAELRIPFSQLRFSTDSAQTWGLQVWRYIDRVNEQAVWSFRRRNEASGPAFFGHLDGLRIARQPRQLEVLPYVVTGSRHERAAPDDPYRSDHELRLGMGADVKYLLTSNLTLDATFNPDFGQVEVDPASLNLSAYETYYAEKRPFFIAGASAFRFGGMRCFFCSNSPGLSAFYSRRIGRPPQLTGYLDDVSAFADVPDDAGIIAAAKITGRTDGGYTVGVLNAVTGRERARYLPEAGGGETQQVVEPLSNYFVGRLKKEFRSGATTFGGIVTSTLRETDDSIVAERLRSHAEVAGVDWNHTWGGREYSWMGSALVSNVAGSAAAIARTQRSSAHYFQRPDRSLDGDGLFAADYDTAATSLQGYGLFSRVGKDNGTLLWEAMTNIRSPGFEANDLSFQDRADFAWFNGNVVGRWTTPTTWYRSLFSSLGGYSQFNFEGDRTAIGMQAFVGLELPNFWNIRLMGIRDLPAFDDRRLRGGPVVRREGYNMGSVQVSTDARARAVFDVTVQAVRGIDAPTQSFTLRPGLALKPAANIFVQLSPSYDLSEGDAQYIDTFADPTAVEFFGSRYVFGFIRTKTVSLSTRVNWTFTPDLTLQLFAQPFIASGDYSSFREYAAPRTLDKLVYGRDAGTITYEPLSDEYRVDPDAGGPAQPFTFENPDFTATALRGTAVLRWEYRPGSTLFLVWTQQRSGSDGVGNFDFDRARRGIFDERPMNVFQVKATWWLGR